MAALVVLVSATLFLAFALAVYLRKRRYPEKSYLNNAVNLMLAPARLLGLGPFKNGALTMKNALKYAVKKLKKQNLTDFGSLDFAAAYDAILSTETQTRQQYTNLGYISGRIELNMTMVRRLKFVDYLKKVPAVAAVPVPSPVFVMGLPRTGTTFLHRLLSLDAKRCRAPLLWELLAPVPAPMSTPSPAQAGALEEHAEDRKKRADFIKKLIATRRKMGDKALEHIHEVGYDLPEECFLALSDSVPCLLQFLYANYMNPDVAMPMLKTHMKGAYAWYKQYLQLLSFQIGETQASRCWMLKCPVHLFYPTEIASAFPDAKLIWTHRHPISAVPSMCSLLKSIHQMYYETECRDDHALGRNILRVSEDLLVQAPLDIKDSRLPCADVVYNSLIADPIGTVKGIYQQFGWECTPEYERALQAYLEGNRLEREALKLKKLKQKPGKSEVMHSYTPEEFGMTKEELCSGGYAAYIKKYSIPLSTN